jgi:N-acetylornithine carbamoyltransferase
MDESLKGKHMITTQDWSREELDKALALAKDLKSKFRNGEPHRLLDDKTLFMIFFFSSTRTRNSFEAGMTQLGGHAHFLTPDKMQISHGENPQDTGEVLSRYGHGIAIRHCDYGIGNKYINDVAKHSKVPVLNMQCDYYHPYQAMADIQTIQEKFGNPEGKKFVISWAYPRGYTRPLSVAQSLIQLMPRYGMDVTLAHPPEFKLMPEIMDVARKNAADAGVEFNVTHDMKEAFEGAHVVYPKSWGPLQVTTEAQQAGEIATKYKDWICNEEKMDLTDNDSIYMHCLPADRNAEVSDAVIDGKHSVVYDEAENRLHAQKALMALTMCGKGKQY